MNATARHARDIAALPRSCQRHERVRIIRRIDIARHWKAVQPFDPTTAFIRE
jgi:hypothetical protein